MFTTVAWSESQDTSNVLTAMTALADPHVRVSGDDIIVPGALPWVMGLFGLGANITRARLESPSLRRILNQELGPVDDNATPRSPSRLNDFGSNPIPIDPEEALNFFVSEDTAGAEREYGIAFLTSGVVTPAIGDIRTVRATGTTTLTANAWTNCALTFDETLPAGTYHLVGARGNSSGVVAFRFVFSGLPWRPGGIGEVSVDLVGHRNWRRGRSGVWGTFEHNTPPTVDFLSTSADSSQTLELDLIKVS